MTLNEYELEMRQRVTRIESRICRIADHLGAQTGDPGKTLVVRVETDSRVDVVTTVMDVSLSDVIRFLTREGIEGKVVNLYFEGKLVARVYPAGDA